MRTGTLALRYLIDNPLKIIPALFHTPLRENKPQGHSLVGKLNSCEAIREEQ